MDVQMNLNPKQNCRQHFIVIIIRVIRENNRDYPNNLYIFLTNKATKFVAECHLIRQIISLSKAWQQNDIQSQLRNCTNSGVECHSKRCNFKWNLSQKKGNNSKLNQLCGTRKDYESKFRIFNLIHYPEVQHRNAFLMEATC